MDEKFKNDKLIELSKKYNVYCNLQERKFEIENLACLLNEDGTTEFFITGIYNSGSDWEEINTEELEQLKEFVKLFVAVEKEENEHARK